MRADMKDVITNSGDRCERYDSVRSRVKLHDVEKLDELPERESIRSRCDGWRSRFHPGTRALHGFLSSNVGRSWDQIYSEICEQADSRSQRGYNLRKAVAWLVQSYAERLAALRRRWGRTRDFYVDADGILCYNDDRGRYARREERNPDRCWIGDDGYERINGCWFQIWYESVEKSRQQWNYLLNRKEVEYYLEEVRVRQKQLSRKELQRLGLSNASNFNWWEGV